MSKGKKICLSAVVVILSVSLIVTLICLIATDDIMLLNPKVLYSNYKTCQKYSYSIHPYRDKSSLLIWVESYYIDSNNGYDYYIETVRNGSKYEANCFVKKKDGENISAFDLQKLNLSKWNDEIYGSGGFYSDGYLYFKIEGKDSIFRIDDSMENCCEFFTPKKFGKIIDRSLFMKENELYYFTESLNLVKYDGVDEEKVATLPKFQSMTLNKQIYMDMIDPLIYNVPVNKVNGTYYYGLGSNLFYVDEDGKAVCFNIKIPEDASYEANFYKIEACKENDKLMSASYALLYVNPKRPYYYFRYVINPKTGHYIRFRQKIGNRYREVSDDVILDYIENLKSLANIGG